MRYVFFLFALLGCIISSAQIKIKTSSSIYTKNSTTTIDLELLNKVPIYGVEFTILTPDGVDIIDTGDAESHKRYKVYLDCKLLNNNSDYSDFQIITAETYSGDIKVLLFSPTAQKFEQDENPVIKFDISIDDAFNYSETIKIQETYIVAKTDDSTLATYKYDEIEIGVSKVHSTDILSNKLEVYDKQMYGIDGIRTNKVISNKIYISNGKKYLIED